MISIEKLKQVKRLVTHANCPDGIASALIVMDAIPDLEIMFVKHGTEQHRTLEPRPGTLFVDFSPYIPFDGTYLDGHVLAKWIQAGVMVLDHHPTQKNVTDNFVLNGLGAYGENDRGECGAWLAYEHVWRPLHQEKCVEGRMPGSEAKKSVREFAELAGVRDTWKKDDPRWQAACEQAEELMFWGFENLDLDSITHPAAVSLGAVLFQKKLDHARTAIAESHRFTTQKGTRVMMFQGVTPTSDAAELLDHPDEKGLLHNPVHIVAGFHYRVDGGELQLTFSTRSHTGYDVGAFCKSRGGGGHKAAAGFTYHVSDEFSGNPYRVFKLLLEEWEQGQ